MTNPNNPDSAEPEDFADSSMGDEHEDADDGDDSEHTDVGYGGNVGGHSTLDAPASLTPSGYNGTGSFKVYASQLFPYAQWTGGSSIHASIGRGGAVPVNRELQGNLILKSMVNSEFFQYMQRVLNKHCPGMEWLITPEDFENLLLLDAHRQVNGLPTTETKARLQNPQTGNYFHRVTMMEDKNVVGGIRIWVEGAGGYTNIGFRYRLEPIVPEGEETMEEAALRIRQRTSHTVVEVNEEIVEIKEAIEKETAEPLQIPNYIEEKDFA